MRNNLKKVSSIFCWLAFFALVGAGTTILNTPLAYGQAKKVLVDLNKASEKELEDLKGVGPATAKKIIAGRPYKSLDELSKAGIPAKTIDSLKPFVTVGSEAPSTTVSESSAKGTKPEKAPATKAASTNVTTKTPSTKLAPGERVNINTATKEKLEALPEIGPVKAQAIIEGRPYKKVEDVMKVKGIKEGTFNKIKDLITVN